MNPNSYSDTCCPLCGNHDWDGPSCQTCKRDLRREVADLRKQRDEAQQLVAGMCEGTRIVLEGDAAQIADLRRQLEEAQRNTERLDRKWRHEWEELFERLRVAEAECAKLRKLAEAVEVIFTTFSRDEEQGFRSRDRQYAIALLKQHLPPPSLSPEPKED